MKTPQTRSFVYPSLTVTGTVAQPNPKRAHLVALPTQAATTTITRPTLFRSYLNEQLTLLYQDYGAHISVQPSQHEIPILMSSMALIDT